MLATCIILYSNCAKEMCWSVLNSFLVRTFRLPTKAEGARCCAII